jgi:hypothetical protein
MYGILIFKNTGENRLAVFFDRKGTSLQRHKAQSTAKNYCTKLCGPQRLCASYVKCILPLFINILSVGMTGIKK